MAAWQACSTSALVATSGFLPVLLPASPIATFEKNGRTKLHELHSVWHERPPTWDMMDKGQKRHRSNTFGGLLVHMPNNLPKEDGIPIPAKRYEAARNALVEIVGSAGGIYIPSHPKSQSDSSSARRKLVTRLFTTNPNCAGSNAVVMPVIKPVAIAARHCTINECRCKRPMLATVINSAMPSEINEEMIARKRRQKWRQGAIRENSVRRDGGGCGLEVMLRRAVTGRAHKPTHGMRRYIDTSSDVERRIDGGIRERTESCHDPLSDASVSTLPGAQNSGPE
ncbi:hypothetical protein EV421DRAFT_1748241 [Armillaria borealis]|uniref:Uncharacterized protein n=1 Tax=Armillaria borealis TaxID=47425 RepID=A0AA39ID71_9AGAR|nr:hypothetical protein EV421DRAFT_1748241 [Armillaria borealis]